MAVRSINLAMGASYGAYNQKLTQATKNKLDELGIPYDRNMTEAEGKRLIEIKTREQASQQEFSNNSSSDFLFEKAKELAKKLGINADKNTDFKALLELIEKVLEQNIALNQNNIDELKKLKSIGFELSNLQAQVGAQDSSKALMMSLEMLSEYNKNFFNK